jgi:MFS family permease
MQGTVTSDPKAELTARVAQKRRDVETWLAAVTPRKRRLLNVTIIGGTMAAAFTTGPAVGGQGFTAWLTMTLGLENPSWRLLCGAAAVSSVAATVATQLLKSQNLEEHLSRAQACRARLEAIEVGLSTGYLDLPKATAEFLRCVEDASFIQAR